MSDKDLPSPGDLIGVRYRIESLLGQGGMGAVFSAVNQATGRAVAIKWLLPGAARSKESVTRFLAEARATAKVEHPNVIQILDVGQDGESPFLVMERLRGESLADRLERGRMPPLDTLEEIIPACLGVGEAHAEGIIHRDLKPDNIFLCRGKDGSRRPPKVLDFGISKLYDHEGGQALTQTGIAMGTPQYMSPEQLNAPPDADARFDVYAMGIVLYECLTGRPPYSADGLFELVQQIAAGNPTPIRVMAPDVPADLEAIVMRAMHVNRDLRYSTVRELVNELEHVRHRMLSGAPAPIPATGAGAYAIGAAQPSYPGGAPTPSSGGVSTGPLGGGWSQPGYASAAGGASGTAAPMGYGHPPSGPHPSAGTGPVAASGGAGRLILGASAIVLALGLFAVIGIGGAVLLLRPDANPDAPSQPFPAQPSVGGESDQSSAGESAVNPRHPSIDLTFTGDCHPTFRARLMVIPSDTSLSVTASTVAGVAGMVQLVLNDLEGEVPISTRARVDTQITINVMEGQQIWTNMALDAGGVLQGSVEDPIRGSLTVTHFDTVSGISDLTFNGVTLQNMRTGSLCTINGRLQTRGRTYGY